MEYYEEQVNTQEEKPLSPEEELKKKRHCYIWMAISLILLCYVAYQIIKLIVVL